MYDIVFISYNERYADTNYEKLKKRFPVAKRINGVKGIHQAHIAAAKKCLTKMVWIVDADALIVDNFNFDYVVPDWDLDTVHVWRSQNPVNDLIYGYGGVKLLPRKLTINMDTSKTDMTTSISDKFKVVEQISNYTSFNTDPYSSWRSAFRECVKLSSKVIEGQVSEETESRLKIWCSVGEERKNGKWAISGALAGKEYGTVNSNNDAALKLINDFDWLEEQFNAASI